MSAETADVAVDIAALFDHASADPEAAGTRAVAVNRRLYAEAPRGFRLDATHIPHLTLAQLFVAEEDIESMRGAISAVLGKVNANDRPLVTNVDSMSPGRADDVGRTVAFDVALTPALAELHAQVVDALGPYVRYGGGPDAFVGTGVQNHSVSWVENFFSESAGPHFEPHITLGIGPEALVAELCAAFMPFPVRIDRIALCRLGAQNTCHDVLADWSWG